MPLRFPRFSLPHINLPRPELSKLSIALPPAVSNMLNKIVALRGAMPQPHIAMPELHLPHLEMPHVSMPHPHMPSLSMPHLERPKITKRLLLISGICLLAVASAAFKLLLGGHHATAVVANKEAAAKAGASKAAVTATADPTVVTATASTKAAGTQAVPKGHTEVEKPAADVSDSDAVEDKKITLALRKDVADLCGGRATPIISWSYSGGYLLCLVKNGTGRASDLLQRSDTGSFTYVGGSDGEFAQSELTDQYGLDTSTAGALVHAQHK